MPNDTPLFSSAEQTFPAPDRCGPRALRGAGALLAASALCTAVQSARAADPAPFELDGPKLTIEVRRGDETLPISKVPSLRQGDRLTIHALQDPDKGPRFIIASAFLRGATNPPPKDWIDFAETWEHKTKDNTIRVKVPEGARQMVLLMVPDTGGAEGVLRDAVRGKPGEFVRAGEDLNQASLDHSRLDAFMAAIRAQGDYHPEALKKVAPVLASSLSIKLKGDCLSKVIDEQASCLLEQRSALVLNDVHSSSLADTLTGTPTDLALQLSATPEAGAGYYSAYIGVARDVARLFGAFSNPQFGYLPALTRRDDTTLSLLLNVAPSFKKPKSVLVAGMPAVEADVPPQLRSTAKGPVCLSSGDAVLPVEGAPLVYSTRFAHDMFVKITDGEGHNAQVPVHARADRGGYVLSPQDVPSTLTGTLRAHLHGTWGFAAFDGPDFLLQRPDGGAWKVVGGGDDLVVGRDNTLELTGGMPGCVSNVALSIGKGQPQAVKWQSQGPGRLEVTLPLTGATPGPARLTVRYTGIDRPAQVPLQARAEKSRIDDIVLHAGDERGELTGQRLEQVQDVTIGSMTFHPAGLSRSGNLDHLALEAQDGAHAPDAGTRLDALVHLEGGRTQRVQVNVATARPAASVISRTVNRPPDKPGVIPLTITDPDVLPDDASMVFSLQAPAGRRFSPDDTIEISRAPRDSGDKSTPDDNADTVLARLSAGHGLVLAGSSVLVGTLHAADLPPSTFGPLQLRVVHANIAGDWLPLAALVRLPRITGLSCTPAKAGHTPEPTASNAHGGDTGKSNSKVQCTLSGQGLYLVDAIGADDAFTHATKVPPGYTASDIVVPAPVGDGPLYLRLRDAPGARVSVAVPRDPERKPGVAK